MDNLMELMTENSSMTKGEAKELLTAVEKTINAVAEDDQQTFFEGITKIARLNRENKKQTMFDIVKSFYRTAQVYEELTNSDENS